MHGEYQTLLIVGGSRNGETISVLAYLKLQKLPVLKPIQLGANPEDYIEIAAEANYEMYEKREYTDTNRNKREFLVYQSLSDEQAATDAIQTKDAQWSLNE